MTIDVTLNNLANLSNQNTAVSVINNNNAAITSAFTSALDTSGDRMSGTLDMNSNQMLNLPSPGSADSPVRLQDIMNMQGATGLTVTVPTVGTSGSVVGYLNGNLTFSGNDTFTGSSVFSNATISSGNITVSTATVSTITVSTGTVTNLTSTNITTQTLDVSGSSNFGSAVFTGDFIIESRAPWTDSRYFGVSASSADNSSSLQAAINYMNSSYGGGTLLIIGNNTVTSQVVVKGSVVLQGMGQNISAISASGNINPIHFDNSCSYAGLKNLEVLGQVSATSTQPAVSITTNVPIIIENCSLYYGSAGLSTQGAECFVRDTAIQGYSSALNSIGGANWYNNVFFDTSGISAINAVAIATPLGSGNFENIFIGCDFSGTYSSSVYINDTATSNKSLTKFIGCVFAAPITVVNAQWTAFSECEIGSTTFTISSSGGVVTVSNCYGLGGSTIIATTSGATKIVTGCYQIS